MRNPKQIVQVAAVSLLIAVAAACGTAAGPSSSSAVTSPPATSSPTVPGTTTLPAVGSLSGEQANGLAAALQLEYKARATYAAAIAGLGNVAPFANLAQSEGQHVDTLTALLQRYSVAVPADATPAIAPFGSSAAACSAALSVEHQVASQYQALLASTQPADLRTAYSNLLESTTGNHIPALTRC